MSANETLRELRREIGRNSILQFAQTYFPQYATHKSPAFHEEICDVLMDMSKKRDGRFALAAPRGHAKSTLASFFYVMWSICYCKEHFILILSATANQSEKLLSSISTALETNRTLREDFPEVFNPKEKARAKWTQEEIVTPNNIMISARSVGQNFRGIKHDQYRPSLIILDDVDGEKNTYNADSRNKVFDWFTQTVLKAGVPKALNIIAVGTLLHPDSLLGRLTKREEFPDWQKRIYKAVLAFSLREDLWQKWGNILFNRGDTYNDEAGLNAADSFFQENKDAMLEGTKVLWEEVEDYYTLMKIRAIEGSYSFDSEKQNDPTNAKDSRYDPDKFYYWDDEFPTVEKLLGSFGDDYSIIAACDPSVGVMNSRSDHSAIIVLAKHKGKLYVIDVDIKQRSQEDLVQAIINFCKIRRHMDKFVIESNLFPELLLKTIREQAYQENVVAPFTEIRNTKNKELRIFGMETYITTGTILFSRKDTVLLDQLKYFPRGDHDDGPDALEMALREAELHEVGFVHIERKDKHGRTIYDKDYGRSTPQEDARDEDDEDDGGGTAHIISLS
ncbi:MAG: phage terminase large subunit [Candidatus Omnitrophota bacterium]